MVLVKLWMKYLTFQIFDKYDNYRYIFDKYGNYRYN